MWIEVFKMAVWQKRILDKSTQNSAESDLNFSSLLGKNVRLTIPCDNLISNAHLPFHTHFPLNL